MMRQLLLLSTWLPALLLLNLPNASGMTALRRSAKSLSSPASAEGASQPKILDAKVPQMVVSQAAVQKKTRHYARLTKHMANATKSEKTAKELPTCQPCTSYDYTMDLNSDDYDDLTSFDGCTHAAMPQGEDQNCVSHAEFLCDCYGTRVCKSDWTPDSSAKVNLSPPRDFDNESLHGLMCEALDHMSLMNPNSDTSCHIFASMGDGHSDICG